MTTADWALTVSLCSAAVSLASFVWNVWSKFIYPKPKVSISFSYSAIVGNGKIERHVISLGATNMGPGEVTLHTALIRGSRHLFRRPDYPFAFLKPLNNVNDPADSTNGPFSGGLPKKVAVGEQFSVYFTPSFPTLASDEYDRIGFVDTFGRHHWAATQLLKTTRQKIKAELQDPAKAS